MFRGGLPSPTLTPADPVPRRPSDTHLDFGLSGIFCTRHAFCTRARYRYPALLHAFCTPCRARETLLRRVLGTHRRLIRRLECVCVGGGEGAAECGGTREWRDGGRVPATTIHSAVDAFSVACSHSICLPTRSDLGFRVQGSVSRSTSQATCMCAFGVFT